VITDTTSGGCAGLSPYVLLPATYKQQIFGWTLASGHTTIIVIIAAADTYKP